MATGLGLRIGDIESVAAIVTSGRLSEPEYVVRPTVLHMSDDGDTVLGDAPTEGTYKTVSGFVEHVGDPDGISVDQGDAYRAEDLVATAMFCLINDVGDRLGEPNRIIASYPTEWSGATVDSVRDSLDYLGLGQVKLVREEGTGSDQDLALGAALVAHDSASGTVPVAGKAGDPQDMTEEFPVTAGPMVGAQAYSTATEIPMALPPLDLPPSSEPIETVAPATRRKTPLIIAAGIAAVLALGGGAAAIALQSDDTTTVPPIRDAQTSAPAAPTTTTSRSTAPIVFAPPTEFKEQTVAPPAPEPETLLPPPPPVTTPSPLPPPPVTTPPAPTTEPPVTVAPTTVPEEEPTETEDPTTTRRFPNLPQPMQIPTFPRPGDPDYGR